MLQIRKMSRSFLLSGTPPPSLLSSHKEWIRCCLLIAAEQRDKAGQLWFHRTTWPPGPTWWLVFPTSAFWIQENHDNRPAVVAHFNATSCSAPQSAPAAPGCATNMYQQLQYHTSSSVVIVQCHNIHHWQNSHPVQQHKDTITVSQNTHSVQNTNTITLCDKIHSRATLYQLQYHTSSPVVIVQCHNIHQWQNSHPVQQYKDTITV